MVLLSKYLRSWEKNIRLRDKYVSIRKATSGAVLKVSSGWVESREVIAPRIKMGGPPTPKKRKREHGIN